jgi:hypothetical protein
MPNNRCYFRTYEGIGIGTRCENESRERSNYCTEHTCTSHGCNNSRINRTNNGTVDEFCTAHLPGSCRDVYCTDPPIEGSSYCLDHTCSVDGCSDGLYDEGYCEYHYDSNYPYSDGDDDDYDRDNDGLYSYDTDVTRILTPDEGDRLYGVELEANAYQIRRSELIQLIGVEYGTDVIVKSDGSLDSCTGVELVTRPLTFENQIKFWGKFDYTYLKCDNRCGMHVHVTKQSLTQLTLGRVLIFLNSARNRDVVQSVAGRQANMYCNYNAFVGPQIRTRSGTSRRRRPDPANVITEAQSRGKYSALNVSKPNTVEFRIFSGTTERKRIHTNLEFVERLVRYCEAEHPIRLTFDRFARFVMKSEGFDNLKEFIEENNLCA